MKSRSNSETVRKVIRVLGMSMREAAAKLEWTERHLYRVLNAQYKTTNWDEIVKKLRNK